MFAAARHLKWALFCAIGLSLAPWQSQGQILISLLFGDELNSGKMEFGLIGQFNASKIVGAEKPEALRTFGLGLYLDYKLTTQWVLQFEANVKTQLGYENIGVDEILISIPPSVALDSYESKRTINAIHVPLGIAYRTKFGIGGGVGFYSSIMHGSRDYYFIEDGPAEITIQQSFTNYLKLLDFGATASLHYHFKGNPGVQIRARVNYGLINIYTPESGLTGNTFWFSAGMAVPVILKR